MLERRGTLRYGAERRIEQFGRQELSGVQLPPGWSRGEGGALVFTSPSRPSSPETQQRETPPPVGWRRSSSAGGVGTTPRAARPRGGHPAAGMKRTEEPDGFAGPVPRRNLDISDFDDVLRATSGAAGPRRPSSAVLPPPSLSVPVPPPAAAIAAGGVIEEGGKEGGEIPGWTHGAAAGVSRGRGPGGRGEDQQHVEAELGKALSFTADEGPPELRFLRRADTFSQAEEDLMSSETTYVAMLREELWQALSAHVARGRREKVEAALNCLEQVLNCVKNSESLEDNQLAAE